MFLLRILFGKLFFAVAPFLNNSLLLVDPTLSGIKINLDVCFPSEDCHGKSIPAEKRIESKSTGDIRCSMSSRYFLPMSRLRHCTVTQEYPRSKISPEIAVLLARI